MRKYKDSLLNWINEKSLNIKKKIKMQQNDNRIILMKNGDETAIKNYGQEIPLWLNIIEEFTVGII